MTSMERPDSPLREPVQSLNVAIAVSPDDGDGGGVPPPPPEPPVLPEPPLAMASFIPRNSMAKSANARNTLEGRNRVSPLLKLLVRAIYGTSR